MELLLFLEPMVLNNNLSLTKMARYHSMGYTTLSSKTAGSLFVNTAAHTEEEGEHARTPASPLSPYRQRQRHADEGELFDVGRGDRAARVRQFIAGVILGRENGSDDKAGLPLAGPPGRREHLLLFDGPQGRISSDSL